jgi:hypothetical protein
MGRSAVLPLRGKVVELVEGRLPEPYTGYVKGQQSILVHGPMGAGKSHMICVLLLDLREQFQSKTLEPGEKRVRLVPLLDCSRIAIAAPLPVFQAALIWGSSDNPPALAKIAALRSVEDLIAFVQHTEDRLVFVYDQWQATEKHEELKTLLESISQGHPEVKVTSAGGNEIIKQLKSTHGRAYLYQVKGGLQKVSLSI